MIPPNVLRTSETPGEQLGPSEPHLADIFTTEVWRLRGLERVGAHLERLQPGRRSSPLHHHLLLEEHLLVLDGVLTVRERLPDGSERAFELHPGELVAWTAGTGIGHAIQNRGTQPATILVVSDEPQGDLVVYPDSGKLWAQGLGMVVLEPRPERPPTPVPWPDPGPAPPHVATVAGVPERSLGTTFGRPLARAVGARQVFINVDRLPPGTTSSPLHRHTRNEELVYVRRGSPTLRQVAEGVETRSTLQPGDVVLWRPDDGLAHQLLNETDEDVVLVVVGDDQPDDAIRLPDRGPDALHVPALARTGTMRKATYWEGE